MSHDRITYNAECERMLQKWENASDVLPHLLIVQPENGGVGCEEFVEKLAKIYHEKKGIPRSFERSFLHLKYSKNMKEGERGLFFDSPRVVAKLYNHFIGVFCIEITDYITQPEAQEFLKLLDYMTANASYIRFVLVVSTNDKEIANEMYCLLRRYIRLARLNMDYADVNTYARVAVRQLQDNGMTITSGFEQGLENHIEKLLSKENFSGYSTIFNMIDDIVYEFEAERNTKLTKGHLQKYEKSSLLNEVSLRKQKKMGFWGGENAKNMYRK